MHSKGQSCALRQRVKRQGSSKSQISADEFVNSCGSAHQTACMERLGVRPVLKGLVASHCGTAPSEKTHKNIRSEGALAFMS